MSAHTPGPWTAVFSREWPYTVRVLAPGGEEVMSQYGVCGSTKQKSYDDFLRGVGFKSGDTAFLSREDAVRRVGEQIANTNLFAAGPELLAACRAIQRGDPQALRLATEAVAKAEGGAR